MVYSTLKELYRLEFIFLYPSEKKRKGERMKRFVCERSTWGKYRIDQEFDSALRVSGMLERITDEMRQPVTKALQDAYEQFSETKELQKFLPIEAGQHLPQLPTEPRGDGVLLRDPAPLDRPNDHRV